MQVKLGWNLCTVLIVLLLVVAAKSIEQYNSIKEVSSHDDLTGYLTKTSSPAGGTKGVITDKCNKITDIEKLKRAYGKSQGQPGFYRIFDFDNNNIINDADIAAIQTYFTEVCRPKVNADIDYATAVHPGQQPPVLNPIGPKTAVVGQLLTFTVTASDINSEDVLSFDIDPFGTATIDSQLGLFEWTPTEEGVFRVIFLVDDGYDVDFEEVTITVTQPSQSCPFPTHTCPNGQVVTLSPPECTPDCLGSETKVLTTTLSEGQSLGDISDPLINLESETTLVGTKPLKDGSSYSYTASIDLNPSAKSEFFVLENDKMAGTLANAIYNFGPFPNQAKPTDYFYKSTIQFSPSVPRAELVGSVLRVFNKNLLVLPSSDMVNNIDLIEKSTTDPGLVVVGSQFSYFDIGSDRYWVQAQVSSLSQVSIIVKKGPQTGTTHETAPLHSGTDLGSSVHLNVNEVRQIGDLVIGVAERNYVGTIEGSTAKLVVLRKSLSTKSSLTKTVSSTPQAASAVDDITKVKSQAQAVIESITGVDHVKVNIGGSSYYIQTQVLSSSTFVQVRKAPLDAPFSSSTVDGGGSGDFNLNEVKVIGDLVVGLVQRQYISGDIEGSSAQLVLFKGTLAQALSVASSASAEAPRNYYIDFSMDSGSLNRVTAYVAGDSTNKYSLKQGESFTDPLWQTFMLSFDSVSSDSKATVSLKANP